MARWSRSRLRTFGIAAIALLGGSLTAVPAVSYAQDDPAPKSPALAAAPDRIKTFAGRNGKGGFTFRPGSGDTDAPYGFVSTGGDVRAKQLSGSKQKQVTARTAAPRAKKFAASAAAATYATTITLATENWSAWNPLVNIWNTDTWTYVPAEWPANSLSMTVSLPAGNYYVGAIYGIYQYDSYLLGKTFAVANKAQTVTLAESAAKEVRIQTDDATAERTASAVWIGLPNGDLLGFGGGSRERTFATPVSLPGMTLRVHEILTRIGASAQRPSPYRYDLTRYWSHPFPASPISNTPIATVPRQTITIKGQGNSTDGYYQTVPLLSEWTGAFLPTQVRLPYTFTEYATHGVPLMRLAQWGGMEQTMFLPDRTLRSGTTYPTETIGSAPLTPDAGTSTRSNSTMQFYEDALLGDAEGNRGGDGNFTYRTVLSAGGEGIAKSETPELTAEVTDQERIYKLEQVATRKVEYSQLSTQVRSEWTFSSGYERGTLPLMDVDLKADGLDVRNRAGHDPVRLTVEPTSRTPADNEVEKVEYSYDYENTWAELPLTATESGAEVSLRVPTGVAYVSLRVSVYNDKGSALRRTVVHALAGMGTARDERTGVTAIGDLQVNNGGPFVLGVSGTVQTTATFTATDPSGIASSGLYLYHGNYHAPDGIIPGSTECGRSGEQDTEVECTTVLSIWDMRWAMNSNDLADDWNVAVWAVAGDGSIVDQHFAATVPFKRMTSLTAADATPEPISAGRWLTVTSRLARADWGTWAYAGFGSQPVALQFNPKATTTWQGVRTVVSDSAGNLSGLAKASIDGSYRYVYAGDAVSRDQTSGADYVDVQ